MKDYRQRCYRAYDLYWGQFHSSSKEEFEFYTKVAKRKFLSFLPFTKSASIIDIACGAGHFLYFLKKVGYTNVYGIDLSEKQLKMARKMGVIEVEQADLFEYLPHCPGKYEMIIANEIIKHLTKEEVLKFLDTLYLALQPGGRVLIGTPNSASLFGATGICSDFTREQGFTPTSLTQVLGVCGFENVEIYGDGPVAHDFKSTLRVFLWKIVKGVLRSYLIVEGGQGRGCGNTRCCLSHGCLLWQGNH
jgi:2-polyprenyl-3-methyl-5-hydroxy-6-metoxy-1,4-benzoquinol methylase